MKKSKILYIYKKILANIVFLAIIGLIVTPFVSWSLFLKVFVAGAVISIFFGAVSIAHKEQVKEEE